MQTLLRQTGAYRLLEKEGESTGFSHAYLLITEDAKNLRAALKTFAKLFFGCAKPLSAAEKRISDLIDGDSFSDCVTFPVEGKKLMVEDAEKILEESTLAPVEGDTKVFLIGDFAEANVQTQNKLLKLLEEPPKGVVFLLGTTSVFPVLPTVLSRTKKLEILPFPTPEIVSFLRRRYGERYDEDTLAICAAASGGIAGDACNLLEGGYYQTLTESAFSLALAPVYKLPEIVKKVGETPYKKELLTVLRIIFRDALLINSLRKGKNSLSLPSEYARTKEVAERFSVAALLYAQEALSEGEKQVKFNAVFSQCIEVCVAKIIAKNEGIV